MTFEVSTTRRRLMKIFFDDRRWDALETEARGLLSVARDDAEAHNLLGIALASQQRFGPAHDEFESSNRTYLLSKRVTP